MNRKMVTSFLSNLLITKKLQGIGKYWASEVSIDYGSTNVKRVDFMQFMPPNQCSVGAIEKGQFICYEIKSCREDIYSGNGLNFLGEQNYIVTTMECYKDLIADRNSGKLLEHIRECNPESSRYYGIIVAIPESRKEWDEFENPTPLTKATMAGEWRLHKIIPCTPGPRKRSITELLFYMLRSGKWEREYGQCKKKWSRLLRPNSIPSH